jgi:hypothetical protein
VNLLCRAAVTKSTPRVAGRVGWQWPRLTPTPSTLFILKLVKQSFTTPRGDRCDNTQINIFVDNNRFLWHFPTMDTQLPNWLQPPIFTPSTVFCLSDVDAFPRTKEDIELREATYNNLFEHVLDAVSGGRSLVGLVRNDPRNIEYGRFLRWIMKSKSRQSRYEEAKKAAAELLVGQIMSIADEVVDEATGLPNDPVWAKIKIDNRWKLAAAWNKKEYGDRKHVEMQIGAMTEDELSKMSSDDLKRLIVEGEYDTENLLEGQPDAT